MSMQPKPSRVPKVLRGFACLEFVMTKRRWSSSDLMRHLSLPPNSKTHFRWINRTHAISPKYIGELLIAEPDAKLVYDLPLWRLLGGNSTRQTELNKLLENFQGTYDSNKLLLPVRNYLHKSQDTYPTILSESKSGGICIRTDLPAFIQTLAEVRQVESELNKSVEGEQQQFGWSEFDDLLQEVFYALSSIGRIPWLKRDFLLLCAAAVNLRLRAPVDQRGFHPDLRIIFGQQQQTEFELSESWWMESWQPSYHPLANPIVEGNWQPDYCDIYELMEVYRMKSMANYSEVVSIELDRKFTTLGYTSSQFLRLVRCWKLGRHTWEPVLCMKTHEIERWMEGGAISEVTWDRISSLVEVAQELKRRGASSRDQQDFIREVSDRGACPLGFLELGDVESAIELCQNEMRKRWAHPA